MNVHSVDAAEREASEVLHSLLSVERIEKPVHGEMHQIVLESSNEDNRYHQRPVERQQWNLLDHHSIFGNYINNNNNWGSTLSLKFEKSVSQEQTLQLLQDLTSVGQETEQPFQVQEVERLAEPSIVSLPTPKKSVKVVKRVRKRYLKDFSVQSNEQPSEGLEDNAHEVRERFKLGCECHEECCFTGLNAENVYKHRLNIAELTKEEHDMYLMGVTMACMADPDVTAKQRIRQRLRAQYVYQGRRVCLSAFLYLENCTLYQLKRIRKHVMTHGVAPRVHGNHGKKPHNVFSLETYRRATNFLKSCIEEYGIAPSHSKAPILFPADFTRKTIYDMYKQMLLNSGPSTQKVMGYTTFRHFMKVQFPHVRFCKVDSGMGISAESKSAIAKTVTNIINSSISCSNNNNSSSTSQNSNTQQQKVPPQQQPSTHSAVHHESTQQQQPLQHTLLTTNYMTNNNCDDQQSLSLSSQSDASTRLTPDSMSHSSCPVSVSNNTILSPTQVTTIPVILSESSKSDLPQQQTAFIVTPVSQLVQPFQTGHAITVTPISNTGYAFATL